MKLRGFFRKECYPSFPSEWDNPENTVFREFYLRCSPDFAMLHELVENHMSDKGNEGVTRYRLMKILKDCEYRAHYRIAQRRKYPHTWRLRWRIRLIKHYFHRRLHTRFFRNQVELCRIADDVVREILKENESAKS